MKMSVLQAVLLSAFLTAGAAAQNGVPPAENNDGQNMQQGDNSAQQRGPHKPPPEALAACDGKASVPRAVSPDARARPSPEPASPPRCMARTQQDKTLQAIKPACHSPVALLTALPASKEWDRLGAWNNRVPKSSRRAI